MKVVYIFIVAATSQCCGITVSCSTENKQREAKQDPVNINKKLIVTFVGISAMCALCSLQCLLVFRAFAFDICVFFWFFLYFFFLLLPVLVNKRCIYISCTKIYAAVKLYQLHLVPCWNILENDKLNLFSLRQPHFLAFRALPLPLVVELVTRWVRRHGGGESNCRCSKWPSSANTTEGAENAGPENEGPENEGPENEGPSSNASSLCNYTVSQKSIPDVFSYNSRKHWRIFIFGRNVTEKVSWGWKRLLLV